MVRQEASYLLVPKALLSMGLSAHDIKAYLSLLMGDEDSLSDNMKAKLISTGWARHEDGVWVLQDPSEKPVKVVTPAKKTPSLPPEVVEGVQKAFELFWNAYPRKGDKRRAFLAFERVIKQGSNSDERSIIFQNIEILLRKYLEQLEREGTEKKYIKLPSTWLNAHEFPKCQTL